MLILALTLACGDKSTGDPTRTDGGADGGSTSSDGGSTSSDGGGADGGGADGGGADGGGADGGGADGGGAAPELQVGASTGALGTVAWLAASFGVDTADVVIQAQRSGVWQDACSATERCVLADRADAVRALSRDGLVVSRVVVPVEVSLDFTIVREDRAFLADELLQFAVSVDRGPAPLELFLSRRAEDETSWWSATLSDWVGGPQALTEADLAAIAPASTSAQVATYTLVLGVSLEDWATEADPGDAMIAGLASESTTGFELGHSILWGDPHVHSDLSPDGCEDPTAGCQGPDDDPAAEIFPRAIDAGLDWAALVDHAEKMTYTSRPGSTEVDVWTRQHEVVREADGTGIIPFLGYEWTHVSEDLDEDGYRMGGHRTVIMEEAEACTDWRISGVGAARDYTRGWGATQVLINNPISANTPTLLREALTAAEASCGAQRALVMAHHSALRRPQPIDWRREANQPDPTWETVMEIASEHGTSECMEMDDPHCDWRVNDPDRYYPQGSFQAALRHGYRLGVTGGSDSHDGRAGSFDDGPSCTSVVYADGTLACQNYQGAATGVLTSAPYDRGAVFDGLFGRKTYATSGPLLPVRAWMQVGDSLFLPGLGIEVEGERKVTVSLVGAYDPTQYISVSIELLNEDGTVLDSVDDVIDDAWALLETVVEPGDCRACYVRIRLYEEEDSEGERIWLSPWFF